MIEATWTSLRLSRTPADYLGVYQLPCKFAQNELNFNRKPKGT